MDLHKKVHRRNRSKDASFFEEYVQKHQHGDGSLGPTASSPGESVLAAHLGTIVPSHLPGTTAVVPSPTTTTTTASITSPASSPSTSPPVFHPSPFDASTSSSSSSDFDHFRPPSAYEFDYGRSPPQSPTFASTPSPYPTFPSSTSMASAATPTVLSFAQSSPSSPAKTGPGGGRRPRSSSRVRRFTTVQVGGASPFALENVVKPLAIGACVTVLIHLLNCYLGFSQAMCPF